jgi:hypothetical protein
MFPFNPCMVMVLVRARLGLLNTERVQPPGNDLIDELRAVIGMKAENHEGGFGCWGAMEQRTGLRARRGSEFASKSLIFGF